MASLASRQRCLCLGRRTSFRRSIAFAATRHLRGPRRRDTSPHRLAVPCHFRRRVEAQRYGLQLLYRAGRLPRRKRELHLPPRPAQHAQGRLSASDRPWTCPPRRRDWDQPRWADPDPHGQVAYGRRSLARSRNHQDQELDKRAGLSEAASKGRQSPLTRPCKLADNAHCDSRCSPERLVRRLSRLCEGSLAPHVDSLPSSADVPHGFTRRLSACPSLVHALSGVRRLAGSSSNWRT